jgi:hypothetical protein
MAADRNFQPVDLKKGGYVEEEFIVTGTANVYDWAADGALTVKTPGVPYGTRILVRRPADSGRFSGDVIVESLNATRRFDWPWIWGYSHESFLEHGDAWVGITMPASSAGLKQFNPARYAAVRRRAAVGRDQPGRRAAQEQCPVTSAGGPARAGHLPDPGPEPRYDDLRQRDSFAREPRERQACL